MGPSSEQSFEFSVGESPAVVVRNPIGTVVTRQGAAGQVAIQATKSVTGLLFGGNGLDLLEKVTIATEQLGDTVTVTVNHPKQLFSSKTVSVRLEIAVPEGTRLDLHVDAGNVELQGGRGVANARVDAGNVKGEGYTFLGHSRVAVDAGNARLGAALGEGASLTLHVDAGNADLQTAFGPGASLDLSVDAGTARLHLPRETAVYLDASVDMGSIKIAGWGVPMKHELVSHKARGPLGPNPNGSLSVHVDAGTIVIAPLD
jgi:hypothetical protein